MEFDINQFLKSYRPKNLTTYLVPYLKCVALKGYHLLEHYNADKLIPRRTYVKYIKIDEAFKDGFYDNHIRPGGILIGGGHIINGMFNKTHNNKLWTHLMLKYDPEPLIDETGKIIRERFDKPKIFLIKMSKYYIFYKHFDVDDKRNYFEVILKKLYK
jgi:hypothetical protein